jgi:hypothetical protein
VPKPGLARRAEGPSALGLRLGEDREGEGRKEGSSFSEEKEAKRLLFVRAWRGPFIRIGRKVMKVFWFFFSKKNRFLIPSSAINDRCYGGGKNWIASLRSQ